MQPSKVFNVLFFSNFARQPRRIDIRPAWRSRQGSCVYRASTTSIGTVSSQRSLFPGESRAENFTPEGLFEDQVQIEDRLRAGSAEFIVTQPRTPCFKLRVRFNRPEMVKRFLESKRTGFYLAVLREGEVAASDLIQFTERQEEGGVTIFDIVNLYTLDSENEDLLRRAAELCALPHGRKDCFPNAFGMPTRNYRFMSGLKHGRCSRRAARAMRCSSAQLSSCFSAISPARDARSSAPLERTAIKHPELRRHLQPDD